jgi:hypothetical protein
MKYSRLIAAAALAGCMLLPSAVQAQTNPNPNGGLGNGGYGIFGNGSNMAGVYSGAANNSYFGRNYNYNPSQIGNFVQSAYTGSYIQPLGLYGLGANGSGSNLSPYLNLLRPGNAAVNYYSGVRPQAHQNNVNGDWATNYKYAERMGEEQLRALQGYDNNNYNNVDWALGYKEAMFEGEKEARRRAGENPEPEYRDWATSYKDQELAGEAKMDRDRSKSRQRAANLRQAKELKELEGELSADPNKQVSPPSLASGLQSYHGPGYPSQFKSYTHYYPNANAAGRFGYNNR